MKNVRMTGFSYRIHTRAIKENLSAPELSPRQINLIYASEAEVLFMALSGMTPKDRCDSHPGGKGNIRCYAREYANVSQPVTL